MYDWWRRRSLGPFRPRSDGTLRTIDVWGLAASIGITAVLLISTLFAFDAASRTDAAASRAAIASQLNERLGAALGSIAAEQSLEREHRLRPRGTSVVPFRRAARAFEGQIRQVARLGDARDARFAALALRLEGAYRASNNDLAPAPSAKLPPLAASLRSERAFLALQRLIGMRANEQELRSAEALAELRTTQHRAIKTVSLLSLLAVACLGVMFVILGKNRRAVAAEHALELRRLEAAALTDHLTQLGNHRAYQEDLHREISRAKRHGYELTLALVDVDDLKLLNDRSGHLHGDRVLSALGTLLGSLRQEDRAYRIGGDEFSILFAETSRAQAFETLERLRLRAQDSLLGGTISGGIATLEHDGDAEALHSQADAALYAAKRGGRNGLTLYDPHTSDHSVVSPVKVGCLNALIASEDLGIVFQPVWDVKRGEVLAYEALARPGAGSGFEGPAEAFALAERVGRAYELDAVSRRATLARAGDLPAGALLFINMSPQSFAGRRLDVAGFEAEVRATGLVPAQIVIEVTERGIKHLPAVVAIAKELQAAGFGLALDDVGSGNAGLEMLTELNVDFVKIDRGVIVKAVEDRNARGVLAGIIVIAKAIGAYVIAEGIENVEMLDLICRGVVDWREMERGIEGAQGYLLRRPSDTFLGASEIADIRILVSEALAAHGVTPPGAVTPAPSLRRSWELSA